MHCVLPLHHHLSSLLPPGHLHVCCANWVVGLFHMPCPPGNSLRGVFTWKLFSGILFETFSTSTPFPFKDAKCCTWGPFTVSIVVRLLMLKYILFLVMHIRLIWEIHGGLMLCFFCFVFFNSLNVESCQNLFRD